MAAVERTGRRNTMTKNISKLISDYLDAANDVASQMKSTYGIDDLWSAYVGGHLPKTGAISKLEGGTYRFHGAGCYFQFRDVQIDIDFGPHGSVDGFDAWRLVRFARETLGSEQFDLDSVKTELSRMNQSGELVKKLDWSRELYFLANNPERSAASGKP